MKPGALWLQARSRLQHGLRTAWLRDITRWKILTSSPVDRLKDESVELHVFTSNADWINLVWGLKSFYVASGKRYLAVIHDDGSLDAAARNHFERLFPGSRIVSRREANAWAAKALAGHPRCLAFRHSNHLSPKVFDFAGLCQSARYLSFDSDLLFFSDPTEMVNRLEAPDNRLNAWNRDATDCYTIAPEVAESLFGVRLLPRINSGLGVVHRESINLDALEGFLSAPGIVGHFWRIEQTLLAMCSSRFGAEHLPAEYDVRLSGKTTGPMRHYVGAIRHQMYREGVPRLADSLLR